jgi:hypothetical protein
MKKNQTIILVILIVLICGGIIGWAVFQKSKIPTEEGTPEEGAEEMFSLSAVVSSVDVENNFLLVKPSGKENEIKVILSDTTKLIKLESPFDSDNPPKPGTQFTPEQIDITLEDFKEGEEIFIKTLKNIAGKTEFNDVELIQILP